MDNQLIKEQLIAHAEECMQLAEHLSDKGRPFDAHEQNLVRTALSGWVADVHEEAKMFFVTGHFKDYEQSTKMIAGMLERLV